MSRTNDAHLLLERLRQRAERELVHELIEQMVEEDLIASMRQWDDGIDCNDVFDDDADFTGPRVEVVRHPSEGRVVGYKEVMEESEGSAAAALSFEREVDPKNVTLTGTSGNAPFMPGGMEEDLAEAEKNPEDFVVDLPLAEYKTGQSISSMAELKNVFTEEEELVSAEVVDSVDIASTLKSLVPPTVVDLLSRFGLSPTLDWLQLDEDRGSERTKASRTPANHNHQPAEVGSEKAQSEEENGAQTDGPQVDQIISGTATAQPGHSDGDYKWARLVQLTGSVPEFDQLKPRMAKTYPFELDCFQKEAIVRLEQGESVFVAAHTSAGKTVVAEYAIALCQRHNTRAVYTSPIKALSNQKFRDFKDMFDDVGLVTGDVQLNPDASCLIMTTEILRSMLYNGSEVVRELEWVIFDEVHYVNDPERGVVWEEVLIMLPDHVKIILLSATVDDILEFAEWIGRIKRRHIYVMKTLKRPVPLEHFLYTGKDGTSKKELFLLANRDGRFIHDNYAMAVMASSKSEPRMTVNNPYKYKENFKTTQNRWLTLIRFLEERDLLPMVAFVFSRKNCDSNAGMMSSLDLTSSVEKSKVHRFFERSIARLNPSDRQAPQIQTIQAMCKRGIAVHHSGVLPIMKEAVEMLFQQGLVKILFATETFAMGVNMPARTVVFDSVEKHDGKSQRLLHSGEYTQMAGRAGRRGLDKTGTVIILCKGTVPLKDDLRNMILGNPPKIQSRFRLTYNMLLNLFRAQPITPKMMLGKSYVENVSFRSIRRLQNEITSLDKRLEEMAPLSCKRCTKGRIDEYYELADEVLTRCGEALRQALEHIPTGRVIIVQQSDWLYLAVVLKSYRFASEMYVEVLMPYARVCRAFNDKNKDGRPYRMLCLSGAVRNAMAVELNAYSLVEVCEKDVAYLSAYQVNLCRRRVEEDWRHTRFKCSPGIEMLQLLCTLPTIGCAVFQEFFQLLIPISPILRLEDEDTMNVCRKQCARLQTLTCCNCQHFNAHLHVYYDRRKMEKRRDSCNEELHRQHLRLLPDYNSRLEVLRRFKYIDEFCIVQLPGKVAAAINQHPLLFTQLLLENQVGKLTPDQLASILSTTSCQHKRTPSEENRTIELLRFKNLLNRIQEQIRLVEKECGLSESDVESELNFNLMHVVQCWAQGMPFCEVMALTDAQEGVVVRCIQRVHEACRDLKTASCLIGDPNLMKLVEDTLLAIRRDIIFTTSLYIE